TKLAIATNKFACAINFIPGSVAPENFHNLLEFALLATKLDPFDPMEKAIKESADHLLRRRSTYTRVGIWCHWCPVVDEANPFNSFYKF
ncbi:MAG: hypothetical protein WCG61_05220, partial [Chlorobium sp.]